MIRLAAFAGKFALFIAGMALLTFISLFVVGAYLASWPIMRVSPRARRMTSIMGLATAAMTVARAYGLDTAMMKDAAGSATEDTEDTDMPEPGDTAYPHRDGPYVVIGPGCFAADDGSVLSWDGRNYVPQNFPDHDNESEGGDN